MSNEHRSITDADLDVLDADLKRRAESIWSALIGDAELFAELRGVLAELRAEARHRSGPERLGFASVTETTPVSMVTLPRAEATQSAQLMQTAI